MVTASLTIDILPETVLEELRAKVHDEGKLKNLMSEKIEKKYPQVVTEIMCSLIGKNYILPKLIEDTQMMNKFFSVLDKPEEEIDAAGAKQFIRIFTTIVHNSELHPRVFSYFYSNNGTPILNLLKFLDFSEQQVSDIIKTSLLYTPSSSGSPQLQKKQSSQDTESNIDYAKTKTVVMQKLISQMRSEDNIDVVCGVLQELVQTERPSPIIDLIVGAESVKSIIDLVLENQDKPHVCDCSIDLLEKIIFATQQGDQCIDHIVKLFDQFVDILKNPNPDLLPPIHLTTGLLKKPFGLLRLRIVEFFAFIFANLDILVEHHKPASAPTVASPSNSNTQLTDSLLNCNVLQILLQLFFEYPNNNLLHNVVCSIVLSIIPADGTSQLSRFLPIIMNSDVNLIPKMIELSKTNQKLIEQRKSALGYIGHIVQMGYALSDLDLDDDEMEEKYEGWNDFISFLKDRNFVETVYRHGDEIPLPRHLVDWQDEEDEEDEFGLRDNDESEGVSTANNLSEVDTDDEFASPDSQEEPGVSLSISDNGSVQKPSISRPSTPAVPPGAPGPILTRGQPISTSSGTSQDLTDGNNLTATIEQDLDTEAIPSQTDTTNTSDSSAEYEWFLEK